MAMLPDSHLSQSLQEHLVPRWVRFVSLRVIGIMILILAILFTVVSYILYTTLNYPEILLDKPSFAGSLLAQGETAPILGFTGLLLCGVLLFIISLALVPHVEEKRHRTLFIAGGGSGICWAIGGLIGFILLLLWSNALTDVAQVLAAILFVLAEIVAPLLLLFWTTTLARQFRAYRVLGALGLIFVLLRSLAWGLNAILPIAYGFYGTAGILNILALLGESLWIFWLLLLGFRLLLRTPPPAVSTQQVRNVKEGRGQVMRRRFLKATIGVGLGIVGVAFIGVRTEMTITHPPELMGDGVPSEPSFIGTIIYLIVMVYQRIHPVTTVAQQIAIPRTTLPLPSGVSLENINASGVPVQLVSAAGASKSHFIIHVHGGGWAVPLQDSDRVAAATLSQATGASVLLPIYRLLPDHPFPAGLQDCVGAYHWLRSQGVAASNIVIMGGSAGANLALAIAVSLRQSGEALPAALVAMSPPTDLAMTGETYNTKAFADPILGSGLAKNSYVAYTSNGATDVRNPLVSPLYANVQGFPSTFLQVGTQEILLSDSLRMADRLKAAGVEVKLEAWPGMFHGWQGQSFLLEARLANEHIVKFIRQHLGM